MKEKQSLEKVVDGENVSCFCLFQILAGESFFNKDFVISTANQTWVSFNASDEFMRISGNSKTWEWPETSSS